MIDQVIIATLLWESVPSHSLFKMYLSQFLLQRLVNMMFPVVYANVEEFKSYLVQPCMPLKKKLVVLTTEWLPWLQETVVMRSVTWY